MGLHGLLQGYLLLHTQAFSKDEEKESCKRNAFCISYLLLCLDGSQKVMNNYSVSIGISGFELGKVSKGTRQLLSAVQL
jgi:hypothetical protein